MGITVESMECIFSPLFPVRNWNCGGGKTGVPGGGGGGVGGIIRFSGRSREESQQQTQPHMTQRTGIEPGPHWWTASDLKLFVED